MERQCELYRFPKESRKKIDNKEYIIFVIYEDDMPIDCIVRLSNKNMHYIPAKIARGVLIDPDDDGMMTFVYKDRDKYSAYIQLSDKEPKIIHDYVLSFVNSITRKRK